MKNKKDIKKGFSIATYKIDENQLIDKDKNIINFDISYNDLKELIKKKKNNQKNI